MFKNTCLLVLALTTLAACPTPNPVGDVTIDCLGSNRAQIDSLLNEFKPLLGGKMDWSAVYRRAKEAGVGVGGCMIAELAQLYLGGTRAQPGTDDWDAHTAFETYRADEANHATFLSRCRREDGTSEPCKL